MGHILMTAMVLAIHILHMHSLRLTAQYHAFVYVWSVMNTKPYIPCAVRNMYVTKMP